MLAEGGKNAGMLLLRHDEGYSRSNNGGLKACDDWTRKRFGHYGWSQGLGEGVL